MESIHGPSDSQGTPTAGAPQVQINLKDAQDIKCEECEGLYFEPAMMFKKVSKLLTGAPKDQVAPIQAFLCKQCGTPCQELMPDLG